MKHWSTLQSALYRVIEPKIGFQIHCCTYDIGQCIPLPRFWVTIGKQIIWDFPKNFMDENEEEWYFYDEAKKLSCLIKEYVDCPVNELLTHEFNDRFKLIPILHVCDRRIGKRRLEQLLYDDEYSAVSWLIEKRLNTV